jgi:hypothetical protein
VYVDSLPWGDGEAGDADSLAHHPLLAGLSEEQLGEHAERLAEHLANAHMSAREVRAILSDAGHACTYEACFRAVMLVASRTFDMSTPLRAAGITALDADGLVPGRFVMIPVFDCLNHPSVTALRTYGEAGERFKQHVVLDACVRWRMRTDEAANADSADAARPPSAMAHVITVHAPVALDVCAGDELWQWYGNAGWGSRTREAWDYGEAKFLAQYGFLPWE